MVIERLFSNRMTMAVASFSHRINAWYCEQDAKRDRPRVKFGLWFVGRDRRYSTEHPVPERI